MTDNNDIQLNKPEQELDRYRKCFEKVFVMMLALAIEVEASPLFACTKF